MKIIIAFELSEEIIDRELAKDGSMTKQAFYDQFSDGWTKSLIEGAPEGSTVEIKVEGLPSEPTAANARKEK